MRNIPNPPIFGFDIDGVLTNDDDGKQNIWLLAAEEFFGKPMLQPSFSIEEAFQVSACQAAKFYAARLEWIYKSVSMRAQSLATLQNLRALGAEIHLITAREERHRQLTADWLAQNSLPYDSLQMRPKQGSYLKGQQCQELGIEFYVDDNLDHAHDVSRRGIYTLLYHASHNRAKTTPLPRVKDWQDIGQHIRLFLKNRL